MAHRVARDAEADLDDVWFFTATESGSVEIADRLISSITHRFLLLAAQPHMGRPRDEDLRPGIRTFPIGEFIIVYRVVGDDVLILRVLRSSRDIEHLLRG